MNKLLSELKRRNVIRVAALYLISAWLIAQIADVIIALGDLPPSIGRTVLIILGLGFPVAVGLSWLFEWTPAGIRREGDAQDRTVDHKDGRRLDFVIIALLSVAVIYFAANHDWRGSPSIAEASIAVLPFQNRSAQADDLYFTDGIHDDLLTQLAKISSLVVISRTSVMPYRDSGKTIPEIARELNVAAILEGGVQRAGDRVRINLQLIDAATDKHLWAETYDRKLSADNVFAIQSEIATSIAAILHARLLPGERQRLATIPTHDLDAYDSYLLGRRQLATRRDDGLVAAREYFSRAIALDPEFALAHAGLADALTLLASRGGADASELYAEAESAARRALELDPELGEAHTAIGVVRKLRGDAEEDFVPYLLRGVELAPGFADARKWYANYLSESRRYEEALEQLQKAVELDPMSPIVRVNLGQVLEALGRGDQARDAYDRALEIDPGFPPSLLSIHTLGESDKSLVQFARAYSSGLRDPWVLFFFVLTYLELGDEARAEQWGAYIERIAPQSIPVLISKLNISAYAKREADIRRYGGELLQFEEAWMPVASRMLLTQDLPHGRQEEARARYEQKYPTLLGDDPQVLHDYPVAIDIAILLKATGETEKAERLLDLSLEVMGTYPQKDIRDYGVFQARTYALKGDEAEALTRLRETIDAGWRRQWWFFTRDDPAFDSLRHDPRFQAMADDIAANMARQLAKVRELEASGDIVLPPAVPD